MRLCMSEITLRSNQIISAVATSRATKATSTLMMTITRPAQLSRLVEERVAMAEQ